MAAAQGYGGRRGNPARSRRADHPGRITAAVKVPVTVDFEGGYSEDDDDLAGNIVRLIDLGIIGIDFEDRVVKGKGLYSIKRQAERILAIRDVSEQKGVPYSINARTDLFLGQGNRSGRDRRRSSRKS